MRCEVCNPGGCACQGRWERCADMLTCMQAEELLDQAGGDVAAALNLHFNTDAYTPEDQGTLSSGECTMQCTHMHPI